MPEREDSCIAGTKLGGQAAAATNKTKYGDSYYSRIGKLGGAKGKKDGTIKGFATMSKEKIRAAGSLGGQNSKPYTKNPRAYQ